MRTRALIAMIAVAAPCLIKAEVVYSNLEGGIAIWNWLPGDTTPEFGDRVALAGTARTLTGITYWLGDAEPPFAGTFDATFRVYAVDPGTQLPGTLLSQGNVDDFAYDFQNFFVPVVMPSVTLPDEVFVTAEITSSTGNRHGVVWTNGPQIGSSDPDVWYTKTGGDWDPFNSPGQGNLGLAVNAVPEPASCAALALGSLAVIARRKRRA